MLLERVKKLYDNEECCCHCENCTCNCCCADVEKEKFEVRENLTDEEIEEIIEREYSYKDPYNRISIRRALKLFGNRYSYHKTEFRYLKVKDKKVLSKDADKLITVTCCEHGDFTINRSVFFKAGCPKCFMEERNPELVNNIFKTFSHKDLPNTREYLKKNYISNTLKKGRTSLIVKEDFITLAESIRDDMYLFDFSSVPDVIEKESSKLLIKFNDPDLNISGDWTTDISHFIERKQLPLKLSGKYLGRDRSEKKGEIVKTKLAEMYPNLDFSSSTYTGMHESIDFRCKVHDIDLTYSSVHSLLKDDSVSGFKGCPECLKEYRESLEVTPSTKTTEEFIKECEEVYGVGTFDYSITKYIRHDKPVDIIDPKTGEVFTVQRAGYFLKGKGNPLQYETCGESLVRQSLEKIKESSINNMIIEREQAIKDKIEGRNTSLVIIDYICHIDSTEIWIEYNGQQHYNSTYYKQFENWESLFEKQLKRDKNVRDYCRENNILLIEIPYTYDSKDSVYKILYGILVDHKNPEDSIKLPKIQNIEEDSENGKL